MHDVLLALTNALTAIPVTREHANPPLPGSGATPVADGSIFESCERSGDTARSGEGRLALAALLATERVRRDQEARYRSLARTLPDIAVFLFDHDLRFLVAEGAALEAQGYRRELVEGRTLTEVLPPERAAALAPRYRAILAGEGLDFTWEAGERSYQIRGRAIRDDLGGIVAGLIVSQDVTARLQAERSLRESEARYRALVDFSSDAILLTAPDGRIMAANPAACRMFRGTEEAICRAGRAGLTDESDPQLAILLAQRDSTGRASGELRHRRLDGTIFPAEVTSVVFQDRDGNTRTSMTVRDITERKRIEDELRASQERLTQLAMRDALTGLPNRRRLGEALSSALSRLRHDSLPVALLLLDLDGFKAVNDTWGHEAGDCLLLTVADRLRDELRVGTTAARLGGDEFAVLLEGASANAAGELAARLVASLSRPVPIGAATAAVTVSVGVAKAVSGDSVDDLLRRADTALYSAKHSGKNRHAIAGG